MSQTTVTGHRRIVSFPELQWNKRPRILAREKLATVREASTNGWDTVYAIPISELNKAIVQKNSTPPSFKVSDPDDPHTTAEGSFGPWQVTPKGYGPILYMDAPIKTGTGVYKEAYALDDAVVTVSIGLDYLPPDQENRQELKVKAATTSAGDPIVVVEHMKFPAGKEPRLTPKAILKGLMQEWFNENLQHFNHVFSVVLVNQAAASESFKWLKPNEVGYANVKCDETHGIFGVLATTSTRKKDRLDYMIAPTAIPVGAPSGFLISSARFLENMVKPTLPIAFGSVKEKDFELVTDTVLRNKVRISIPVDTGSNKYTGTVDAHGMTLDIKGTRLILSIPKLTVNISPGIDAEIDLYEELEASVKRKADGTNVLWFDQIAKDSSVTHQVVYADWVTGLEIGADIVAGIILSLIGMKGPGRFIEMGMSKIAARIVTGLIVFVAGAVVGALTNIPKFIALANAHQFDKLPSLEALVVEGLNTVQWPNSSGYNLNSAGLSGSFQIGLDPKFLE
jgi:hypothetical protein